MQTVSKSIIRQISGGSLDLTPGYYIAKPVCGIPGASGEYPIIVLVADTHSETEGDEIRVLIAGQSDLYFPEQFVDYRPLTVDEDNPFDLHAAGLVIALIAIYTIISVVGALAIFPSLPFPWLPITAALVAFPPLMLGARLAYQVRDQIAGERQS